MEFLVAIAVKSLLIAGATLLLLQLMRKRSAADRSLIAHLGLASIAILPLAWLLLPQLEVATTLVDPVPVAQPAAQTLPLPATEVDASPATFPEAADPSFLASIDWAVWTYALPAGVLLLLTLIALGRLVVLQAKASVLVEPNWLTALAQAQRRMGFKHGTALLTSDDLSSPISWGLMRPVILLNSEAAEAHAEAEAIIAHELAHVARLDWIKLLLSRFTVALFWFNPLVWLLAREAHQLREEAADDAVLASNIEDTEYAKLLVGIARHECRGLLIGAHGVAPARNSLARRVQRVLDAALARAPGGWRWTAAAGFFAAGMAVPLAVLQFVPTTPAGAASVATVGGKRADAIAEPAVAAAAAAAAISTAVEETTGVASMDRPNGASFHSEHGETVARAPSGASVTTTGDKVVMRAPNGATVTIFPRDAQGKRRTIARGPDGAEVVYDDSSQLGLDGFPGLSKRSESRRSDKHDNVVAMAALGINRSYARELEAAGLGKLGSDELIQLRALGVDGAYVSSLGKAGMTRLTAEDLTEMRAVGVSAPDVSRYRQAFGRIPSVNEIVEIKALRIDPGDVDTDPDDEP